MAGKTIKVIKTAFFNLELLNPGRIIKNFTGKKIPSWAIVIDDKKEEKKEADCEQRAKQGNAGMSCCSNSRSRIEFSCADPFNASNQEAKSEEELAEELDILLTEAVEKDIIIENVENKTIIEQIAELKKLLGKE